MRKVFAFITLLCTVCLNVQCQKAEVHLADGSTVEIPVDEIDSITFSMTNPFNFETKTVKLNSGYEMPIIGIGTYLLSTAQAEESVYHALKVGMRLIDTADIYGNEVGVGGRGTGIKTLSQHEVITDIAQAHGKSAYQVLLRWHLQCGTIAIPGSSNAAHIAEDYDIFDFELTPDEMQRINALECNHRFASY